MHLPTFLFQWVLLAFVFVARTTSALPLSESSSIEIPREHHDILPSIHPKRHLLTSSTPTHALTLYTYTAAVPLSVANAALHEFYSNLYFQASGPWCSMPALPRFTAEWGNTFMAFQASPPYTIPWDFVAEFAERMIEATERGWSGVFSGEYVGYFRRFLTQNGNADTEIHYRGI